MTPPQISTSKPRTKTFSHVIDTRRIRAQRHEPHTASAEVNVREERVCRTGDSKTGVAPTCGPAGCQMQEGHITREANYSPYPCPPISRLTLYSSSYYYSNLLYLIQYYSVLTLFYHLFLSLDLISLLLHTMHCITLPLSSTISLYSNISSPLFLSNNFPLPTPSLIQLSLVSKTAKTSSPTDRN